MKKTKQSLHGTSMKSNFIKRKHDLEIHIIASLSSAGNAVLFVFVNGGNYSAIEMCMYCIERYLIIVGYAVNVK